MYECSSLTSMPARTPPSSIDDHLWQEIDEVMGGSAHFRNAHVIQRRGLRPQVMVVVVERRGLPSDENLRRRFGLTIRQSEVARLLAERLSNEEVAQRLGVTVNTARTHCERVLGKLGVRTRNHVREALLDPEYATVGYRGKGAA
jgi:DNA-binding CsgD family transcriptional regulator